MTERPVLLMGRHRAMNSAVISLLIRAVLAGMGPVATVMMGGGLDLPEFLPVVIRHRDHSPCVAPRGPSALAIGPVLLNWRSTCQTWSPSHRQNSAVLSVWFALRDRGPGAGAGREGGTPVMSSLAAGVPVR